MIEVDFFKSTLTLKYRCDEQHEELSRLVTDIDDQGGDEFSQILSDAGTHGARDAVNEIWQMDSRKMREVFAKDQSENRVSLLL